MVSKTHDIFRMNTELNELRFKRPKADLNGLRSEHMQGAELKSGASLPFFPDQDSVSRRFKTVTKPQQMLNHVQTNDLHEANLHHQHAELSQPAGPRCTFQKTVREGLGEKSDYKPCEVKDNAAAAAAEVTGVSGRKYVSFEIREESPSQKSESSLVLERWPSSSHGPGMVQGLPATTSTQNIKIGSDEHESETAAFQATVLIRNENVGPDEHRVNQFVGSRRSSNILPTEPQPWSGAQVSVSRRNSNIGPEEPKPNSRPEMTPEIQVTGSRRNVENGFHEPEIEASGSRISYARSHNKSHMVEIPEIQAMVASRRNSRNGSDEHKTEALGSKRSSHDRLDESRRPESPQTQVRVSGRNSRNEYDEVAETSALGSKGSSNARLHESSRPESPETQSIRSRRNSQNGSHEPESHANVRWNQSNRPESPETQAIDSRRKLRNEFGELETQVSRSRTSPHERVDGSSRPKTPEIQASRRNSRTAGFEELEAQASKSRRSPHARLDEYTRSENVKIQAPRSDTGNGYDEFGAQVSGSKRSSYVRFDESSRLESPEFPMSRRSTRNGIDDLGAQASRSRRGSHARLEESSKPVVPEAHVTWSRRNSRNATYDEPETQASGWSRSSYAGLNGSSRHQSPEIQGSRRNSRSGSDELETEASKSRRNLYDKLDDGSSRHQSPKIQTLRRNSMKEFEESGAQGLGSRKSSYGRLEESSKHHSPEIQASRKNSRNGFDEVQAHGLESRRSSYARLDESNRAKSPEIQTSRRNSQNTFDEVEAQGLRSRSSSHSPVDEFNSFEVPEEKATRSRRNSRNGHDGLEAQVFSRSSYTTLDASGRHVSPEMIQASRSNVRNEFDEPESHGLGSRRNSYPRLDEESSRLQHPVIQASRRNLKHQFDERETQTSRSRRSSNAKTHESSRAESPEIQASRRNSRNRFDETQASGGSRRDPYTGFDESNRPPEIQMTGSKSPRRHSKIRHDEDESQASVLRKNSYTRSDESRPETSEIQPSRSRRNSRSGFHDLENHGTATGLRKNLKSSHNGHRLAAKSQKFSSRIARNFSEAQQATVNENQRSSSSDAAQEHCIMVCGHSHKDHGLCKSIPIETHNEAFKLFYLQPTHKCNQVRMNLTETSQCNCICLPSNNGKQHQRSNKSQAQAPIADCERQVSNRRGSKQTVERESNADCSQCFNAEIRVELIPIEPSTNVTSGDDHESRLQQQPPMMIIDSSLRPSGSGNKSCCKAPRVLVWPCCSEFHHDGNGDTHATLSIGLEFEGCTEHAESKKLE